MAEAGCGRFVRWTDVRAIKRSKLEGRFFLDYFIGDTSRIESNRNFAAQDEAFREVVG